MTPAATTASPAAISTSFVLGMRCQACGHTVAPCATQVCEECFGPLGIAYDDDAIARVLTRAVIEARPRNMWRYAELLPLTRPPSVGAGTGMTPLVKAERLARVLGVDELWIKDDGASHPTLSFKDRVVSVAVSKAIELGLDTIACTSTGNLANATAAQAAVAGLKCVVFIPDNLEPAKILGTSIYGADVIAVRGTYDDVNRLCTEIADRYPWGFVNVNLKPFYAEGSKTMGFEIVEQLGWRVPAHTVVPMAGGSLLTKIAESYEQLARLGLVTASTPPLRRVHGAQGAGCAPIVEMVRENREQLRPIKTPVTIAKSLAIGNPADGYEARQAILASGGFAAAATDDEIIAGMRLIAETEGLFVETAGGVAVAALRHLLASGHIGRADGPIVLCNTGHGLKTQDPLLGVLPPPTSLTPTLADFEAHLRSRR
jgi:threonine synthase